MHEVVVMAVKKAVSAATMTFTATSMMRFFIYTSPPFLALRSGLLADPVLQRRHLLDVLLLGGIRLLGREVYLLLHTVGGQRTQILEGHGRDLVLSASLGLEADVHALHVGVRVPLTLQQGSPGDALLGALHGGHERAESVDLDGVTLREQLADTA